MNNGLKEITIPATVTTISDELLIGNTNIKAINFLGSKLSTIEKAENTYTQRSEGQIFC